MSRANVSVRPAGLDDVPALVVLAEAVKLGPALLTARSMPADRHSQLGKRFEAILASDRRTVLAAFDESDHGLVGLMIVFDDELGPVDPTRVLHISHLAVSPIMRRHGIGRTLMAAAVRMAEERNIDHVMASATSSSREANRYLARLGFAPLMIRRLASTTTLCRSLGIAEVPDRLAARRRVRAGRGARPVRISSAARMLGRGA